MHKRLLMLTAGIALSSVLQAQIIFHDIQPDTTVSGAESGFFSLKPVAGDPEIVIRYFPAPASISAEQHGNCELLFRDGFPARLQQDDNIAAASVSWSPAAIALNSGGSGNWQSDATDKYLGFRFRKTAGGAWHYGWLKMTVAANASSFTVKEWAYDNEAGKAILAGQKAGTPISGPAAGPAPGVSLSSDGLQFTGLEAAAKYKAAVYSADGRQLVQGTLNAGGLLPLGNIPQGIYLIRLGNDRQQYHLKLMIPGLR